MVNPVLGFNFPISIPTEILVDTYIDARLHTVAMLRAGLNVRSDCKVLVVLKNLLSS